jgi:hypothetical protein
MVRFARLFGGGFLLMAACNSWQATTMPLPEVIADHGDRIRVTQRDVGQIEIREPVIVRDTLRGLRARTDAPVAIPVADILRVESRGLDGGRTTWLIAGILAVATTALVLSLVVATTSWQ